MKNIAKKTRHNPSSITDLECKIKNPKNRVPQFIAIEVLCVFNYGYMFNFCQGAGTGVILQEYNHLKPPDVDLFCHGGRNS